jgi:hypothetical protein
MPFKEQHAIVANSSDDVAAVHSGPPGSLHLSGYSQGVLVIPSPGFTAMVCVWV